jgi:hypothetical protein
MHKFFKKKSKEPSENSPLIQANQAEVDNQSAIQAEEELFSNIQSAVKADDLTQVNELLKQVNSADILNKTDAQGFTLLCYIKSAEVLNVLVKKGANIHEVSKNIFDREHTPLSSACALSSDCVLEGEKMEGKMNLIEPILQHYSLSDLEKKPPYIENNESFSLIWDAVYRQKLELQMSLQELPSAALKSEHTENSSKLFNQSSGSDSEKEKKEKHTEARLHC